MTNRCGFVAIIGEPNAGKSTLINALIGQKISIVTPKPQTTRFNVRGILTEGECQMILVDTPGIFAAPHAFEKAMVKSAWAGAGDADAVLLLVDAKKGVTEPLELLMSQLSKLGKKAIYAAINKVDKIEKDKLLALAKTLGNAGSFRDIFFVSALKKDGLTPLKKALFRDLPEGEFLYPDEAVSDIQMRMLAAEITREKLFLMLGQELPYSLLVETESFEEKPGRVVMSQIIYVERETHKKMVIGAGGAMLKRIGSSARRELEKQCDCSVHLSLFVKVRPGWKDAKESYQLLGLER